MSNLVLNTSYLVQNRMVVEKDSTIFIHETRQPYPACSVKDSYTILHNNEHISRTKSNAAHARWHNDEYGTYTFDSTGYISKIGNPIEQPFNEQEKRDNEKLKSENKPPLKKRKWYHLSLEQERELKENNVFQDLAYSIFAVHDFRKPVGHFQSQMRTLRKEDYETVEKGRVYMARTAFGKIVNTLPYENKFEFSVYISRKYETHDFRKLDYILLLEDLIDYIEERIHNQGRLLVSTNNTLKLIGEKIGDDLKAIGFYDEEVNKGNLLERQASYFEELFDHLQETNLLERIKNNVRQEPNKEFFNDLFKNRRWPLYLN